MGNNSMTGNENRDPITGEPGAHPLGTGLGAALAGVAAAAATGSVAGPVGTVVGAAIGAVIGGLAGKGVAESFDPTAEDAYWRDNYRSRPYVDGSASYDDYGPAYTYGLSAHSRYPGRPFEDIEPDLSRDWGTARGTSTLPWEQARSASRDAWGRIGDRSTAGEGGDTSDISDAKYTSTQGRSGT